jgi:hypothetical protein
MYVNNQPTLAIAVAQPSSEMSLPRMENESTFVAPEGVYSVTEEHKPPAIQAHSLNNPALYATRLSYITVRFPAVKPQSAPGLAQLLGGGKDREAKKEPRNRSKEREDGASVSSSETPEEGHLPEQTNVTVQDGTTPASPSVVSGPHNLFSNPVAAGKKKSRPKHSIRTTSSTFITRVQSAEGLTKWLQSKQGEVVFWFYNVAKTFFWVEAVQKAKVRTYFIPYRIL